MRRAALLLALLLISGCAVPEPRLWEHLLRHF